jgi:hypothetical protein
MNDEILAIRVYGNAVYVASRLSDVISRPCKIWKHSISTPGSLGLQTLVLDMSTTSFASRVVTGIEFNPSGTLFLLTDAPNSLLIVNLGNNTIDYFYKDLISHTANNSLSYWLGKHMVWGNNSNIYLIGNDTLATADAADAWRLLKVKMGSNGSPYFY